MARTVYLRGRVERQDGDGDDGPLRFVAATEGVKADGLDLRMDRVSLDRFKSNPVIMYGHDYFGREALPIGRAEDVFVDDDRLLADVVFDRNDDFAANVERKYRDGFMSAVSVGFEVSGRVDEDGVPDSWEMLELSAVPIGLDPEALVESGRALQAYAETLAGRDDNGGEGCPECTHGGRGARGESLAAYLNGRIDELVERDNDLSRPDVISRMARAADISESTVNQILRAEIACPPAGRLEGFASALDVSASAVVDAAEGDGCEYDRNRHDSGSVSLNDVRRRYLARL